MALTKQDEDTIELIAIRIGDKINKGTLAAVRLLIEHHQQTCPHGRKLLESKWFLAGVLTVLLLLTAGGGTLGVLLGKLLTGA